MLENKVFAMVSEVCRAALSDLSVLEESFLLLWMLRTYMNCVEEKLHVEITVYRNHDKCNSIIHKMFKCFLKKTIRCDCNGLLVIGLLFCV